MIKKGNAQGSFDKFCYGFVTLLCDQKRALQVISNVQRTNPNWKMNIKDESFDNREKFQMRQNNQNMYPPPPGYHPQMHSHHPQMQPPPMMYPHQQQHQHHQMRPNYGFVPSQSQNDRGQIKGEKTNKIIVRELWLGGIPQLTDHNYMKDVMSRFGQVEATEIFPKFAFVKYKKAADSATAYERAHMIYQTFGENSGFRIAFSDPSRRKDIVGNHYQYERNSVMLPILFLGFPPITSANIDLGHMLSICEKFGPIVNFYMKKSTNSQMRSYFLFTYDSLKTALKAKQQLSRRKDYLGQKRVEITLLLEENSILQGHDFSYTQKNYVNDPGDRAKKPFRNFQNASYPSNNNYPPPPQVYPQNNIPPLHMSNNPNIPYQPNSQYYDQSNRNPQQSYYYPPPHHPKPQEMIKPQDNQVDNKPHQDVLSLLDSVLDQPADKKAPQKDQQEDYQNPNDIISKILGVADNNDQEGQLSKNQDQNKQRQPNWAGFLTWRGARRAGVDGYTVVGQCQITDYNINVSSVMDLDDVVFKDKAHMMILEPTNSISEVVFSDYLRAFKKRAGVSVTKNWLIYLLGKNFLSDKTYKVKDNQLLMVMEKANLVNQIKDKTVPCDDIYFE